jgi:fructose-1,6-bisphosphatase I
MMSSLLKRRQKRMSCSSRRFFRKRAAAPVFALVLLLLGVGVRVGVHGLSLISSPSISAPAVPRTLLSQVGRENAELLPVFAALQSACKSISTLVRESALRGAASGSQARAINASGDEQKPLDVLSNEVMKGYLADCGAVGIMASEEEDGVVEVLSSTSSSGKFVCVFDPLDGSSNIAASIPTGTIFGIYEVDPTLSATANALQSGNRLVAAGYALYSGSTVMAVTMLQGTHFFTLDCRCGEFVLTKERVQMPERGSSYSLNEARELDWAPGLRKYIRDAKNGQLSSKGRYDLVYVCSLVADVHWCLLRGGTAMNPRSHLRLVYEGNPMGLVVEQAGGTASTGVGPMLLERPQTLHQRIPTFLGSKLDIAEIEEYGRLHHGVQQLGNLKYEV